MLDHAYHAGTGAMAIPIFPSSQFVQFSLLANYHSYTSLSLLLFFIFFYPLLPFTYLLGSFSVSNTIMSVPNEV